MQKDCQHRQGWFYYSYGPMGEIPDKHRVYRILECMERESNRSKMHEHACIRRELRWIYIVDSWVLDAVSFTSVLHDGDCLQIDDPKIIETPITPNVLWWFFTIQCSNWPLNRVSLMLSHTQIQYSMTTSCEMMVNSFTFAQVPFWLKSLLRDILYHPSYILLVEKRLKVK